MKPHRPRASESAIIKARWTKFFGGKCMDCGTTKNLTYDHIIPKIWGGGRDPQNRQVLCKRCNWWKDSNALDYRTREQRYNVYAYCLYRKVLRWYSRRAKTSIPKHIDQTSGGKRGLRPPRHGHRNRVVEEVA